MSQEQAEINLEYLDTMSGGDADMRNTLLDMLIEELPRELSILMEASQKGDIEAIFQASHSLKSTLSYTGHLEAIGLNEQIEAASRQMKWGIHELNMVDTFQGVMSSLIESLTVLSR